MSEPVEAYAWCILQVTLLATVACGVYVAMRRMRAGGGISLLAATLTSVALLTSVCLSPWPRWNLQPHGARPASPQLSSLTVPADSAATVETATLAAESEPIVPNRASSEAATVASEAMLPDVTPVPRAGDAAGGWPWLTGVVVAAWLLGVVGLVRFVCGLVHLGRCRHRSVPVDDPALTSVLEELKASLSAIGRVELRESAATGVPATIGWFRPAILLPHTWRDWSADERRAVLAHEMAHVAGRHFRAWLIGQFALAAHLYHPLVHWLARRLRLELELSADRLAAGAFGDRRQYAAALAGIALSERPVAAFPGLGLLMARPLLMRRMAMLQQPEAHRRNRQSYQRLILLLVSGVTLAVMGLRGGADVTAADTRPAPPAEPPAHSTVESITPATAPPDASHDAGLCAATALFQVSRQPPSLLLILAP